MASSKDRFNYKDEGYHMPDGYEDDNGRVDKSKRDAVLTTRYVDETQEKPKSDQEIWEEEKIRKAKGI